MKRKASFAPTLQVDLDELAQCGDDPFDVGSIGRAGESTSDGRPLFALHSKLATHLSEQYAKQRRKRALREVADASKEKCVTFPVALESTDGSLIELMSLVIHTGPRFLSRSDFCTPGSHGGTRTLCPPDADEATVQRYASEATGALVEILNGSAPAALPLEAIAGLLEQAQYFGAMFIVTMLPYYFQPLASQLNADQAGEVLARSLCTVQGAEATRAYKELVQILTPCIASPSAPVEDFSAAALQIVTGAQSICAPSAHGFREVHSMLLQLANDLAEFKSVALTRLTKRSRVEQPRQVAAIDYDSDRYNICEALMALVFAAAACATCPSSCSFEPAAAAGIAAVKEEEAGPQIQDHSAVSARSSGDCLTTDGNASAPTLHCCITRCRALLCNEGGPLDLHAKATLKLLMRGAALCGCREAALDAVLDGRSPLQRAAAPHNNTSAGTRQYTHSHVMFVRRGVYLGFSGKATHAIQHWARSGDGMGSTLSKWCSENDMVMGSSSVHETPFNLKATSAIGSALKDMSARAARRGVIVGTHPDEPMLVCLALQEVDTGGSP